MKDVDGSGGRSGNFDSSVRWFFSILEHPRARRKSSGVSSWLLFDSDSPNLEAIFIASGGHSLGEEMQCVTAGQVEDWVNGGMGHASCALL